MQIIKILFIFFSILNFFYSSSSYSVTIYYCKTVDGKVGFYDRPCELLLKQPIIKQTAFVMQNYGKGQNFTNINRLSNINKFLRLSRLIKKTKIKRSKRHSKAFLRTRRCKNAEEKIIALQELLKNDYKGKLPVKLKRSLARYKMIKKKNCTCNTTSGVL